VVAANLGLRFLLELVALSAVGWWGWQLGGSTFGRVALAAALPLVVALVWGAFIAPKARFEVSPWSGTDCRW
jgi:cytochrome b